MSRRDGTITGRPDAPPTTERSAGSPHTPEVTGRSERMVEYRFKWIRRERSEPDDRKLAPRALVHGPHHVEHLTWSDLKRAWARMPPRPCPVCRGALIRFSERFGEERPADREVTGVCVHCGIEARWRELRGRLASPTLDLQNGASGSSREG